MNLRKLILLVLFLISLITSLLPQNVYFIVLFSIFTWVFLPLRKWWDNIALALLFFSFFYASLIIVRGLIPSGSLLIAYMISPVSFYRFGHYLANGYTIETQRHRLVISVVVLYLIHMFLLTFVDISVTGIVNEDRTLLGHSIENDALSATLYGLMSSIGIGCIGAVFSNIASRKLRLAYLLIVLLSLLTVVHLVNRTGVVLIIIGLITVLLYNSKFRLSQFILYLFAAVVFVHILLYFEIISSEIITAYQARETHDSYGMATAGGRMEGWQVSLYNLFTCPIGWQLEYYAHNLWLDIARVGGWLPFISFIIATVLFLKRLIVLIKKRQSSVTNLLFTLNIVMLIAAGVEPVIEGSISFFLLLLMMWGFTSSISKENTCKRQ